MKINYIRRVTVTITNQIILGEKIDEKTYWLDINVLMNDNTIINLEMQVENEHNWVDRSLQYVCRNFSTLQKGREYNDSKPVIHIGFLNYTLFPECPEFFAQYMLLNQKNHHIFSDKIMIGVVDLNRTDMATMEDKEYKLDKWVALFKSKTWEEIRMIAKESDELLEASESIYKYNVVDSIQSQCYAREEYYRNQRTRERDKAKLEKEISDLKAETQSLESQKQTLESQKQTLESQKQTLESQKQTLESQKQTLETKNDELLSMVEKQAARIKELEESLKKK